MKNFIMEKMGYLISLLVVLFYFFFSYFSIEGWRLDIQALTEGILLFICSIIMTNAMLKQGIQEGKNSKAYQETSKSHLTIRQKVMPKIKYLQPWFDKDYLNLSKIERDIFVKSAGFDYEDLFDDTGKIKVDFKVQKPKFAENLQKSKLKALKKLFWLMFSSDMKVYREKCKFVKLAKKCKVTRLTVSKALNVEQYKDPNDFGLTISQYEKKQTSASVLTKVLFSVFFPSISFVFYGFSVESLIVQLIVVSIALISSLFAMFSSYIFMVRDHRTSIQMIINKLEEFDNADLSEFKEKENERIYSEKSVCTESPVVEEIRTEPLTGENSDVCSNT